MRGCRNVDKGARGGLESEKASILLDPKDPLFSRIGLLFLGKYEAAYGKADLFMADSF